MVNRYVYLFSQPYTGKKVKTPTLSYGKKGSNPYAQSKRRELPHWCLDDGVRAVTLSPPNTLHNDNTIEFDYIRFVLRFRFRICGAREGH
jgi:hypothetical protein